MYKMHTRIHVYVHTDKMQACIYVYLHLFHTGMESLLLIHYFIMELGKSIRLSEKIPCRRDVLAVTSCHWSTFQVSAVSQQTFLDQLPPAGPSASLSIGYSVHQCYFLDSHLDMLANWS